MKYKKIVLVLSLSGYMLAQSLAVTYAAEVTGKAKVLSTGAYLDFTNYNSDVSIDNVSGNFSGFAFSEDLGWVAFGTTDNSLGPVNVNLVSGAVTGKAKVLNTDAYLDFTNYSSNVVIDASGNFGGYAFSEDMGWLNFSDTGVFTSSIIGSTSPPVLTPASPPECGNNPPTSAPKIYSAAPQSESSVLLSFVQAGDPVDRYVLEYGTLTGGYKYSSPYIGGRGTTNYLVQSLSADTTYYFRIRAGNGCAVGTWSNEISTRTKTSSVVPTTRLQVIETKITPIGEVKKIPQTTGNTKNYQVKVMVVNQKDQVLKGAKVTLDLEYLTLLTDINGLASFPNILEGEHEVALEYDGYEGKQTIYLSGDNQEFVIRLKVLPQNIWLTSQVIVLLVFSLLLIIIIIYLVYRMYQKARLRSPNRNFTVAI